MSTRETRSVPAGARRFWYCFGGLAFFTAMLLAVSGVFLSFYYQPTPDRAYASVFYISNYVHYGWLMRSAHVWGARLMIGFVVIHMVRVFLTGSYKPPRQLNWIAGTMLFVVTLAFAVTGDLLPWDRRGYASMMSLLDVLSRMPLAGETLTRLIAGGERLEAAALTRAFAMHVIVLPAALAALLVAHFRMIRRHGISEPL